MRDWNWFFSWVQKSGLDLEEAVAAVRSKLREKADLTRAEGHEALQLSLFEEAG